MSRLRLPRRIAASIPCAAILAALTIVAAPSAHAQLANPDARERETGSRTTIGTPNARACTEYVMAANSSDEAVLACDRAVESEQLNRAVMIAIRTNRGALHLRRHEGQLALADFDAVIAIDRRNAEAHLNRGAALIMLNQPGPAVAAITEALSLGVREPHKAYFNRGAAREALGDLHGAYEDYSTALEIQPDWGPANAELARFVRTRRDHLAEVLNGNPATP